MKRQLLPVPALLLLLVGPSCAPLFDAGGGEHTYKNGITLRVPPGALTEKRRIAIKKLDADEMAALMRIRNVAGEKILFAFKGPDDLTFALPATLTVPVEQLPRSSIPMIMHFDLSKGFASVANVSYALDVNDDTLALSVHHFSGYEAEIEDEIHRNECTDATNTTCRCGDIEVSQSDNAYSCSIANCQVLYSENSVKFLECLDAPEESSIFEEVSPGCVPNLTVESEKPYIEPGERSEITAKARLGCAAPLEAQIVTFAANGPGTIGVISDSTDTQGIAETTLTAGNQEGTVDVTADSHLTFYRKRIQVNGQELLSEQESADLADQVSVYVVEGPVLEVSAADATMAPNDTTTVTATVSDDGIPLEDQIVSFAVSGPADVSPPSSSTSSSGQAVTTLAAHDASGVANVSAHAEIPIVLPNGEQVLFPVDGSASVTVAQPCDEAAELYAYSQQIHAELLAAVPFESTWTLTLNHELFWPAEIRRIYPVFAVGAPPKDEVTAETEYGATTTTSFVLPEAPEPPACDFVKAIQDGATSESEARETVAIWLLYEALGAAIEGDGSGTHWSRVGRYISTNRAVTYTLYALFGCWYHNPCPNILYEKSGCEPVAETHTVRVSVFPEWEPNRTAALDFTIDSVVASDPDRHQLVTWDDDDYEVVDPTNPNYCEQLSPVCLGGESRESECGLGYWDIHSLDAPIPLKDGSYQESRSETEVITAFLQCVQGCECTTDSDCDDGRECTEDSCVGGECRYEPDDSLIPEQVTSDCRYCDNGVTRSGACQRV